MLGMIERTAGKEGLMRSRLSRKKPPFEEEYRVRETEGGGEGRRKEWGKERGKGSCGCVSVIYTVAFLKFLEVSLFP